MRKKKEPVIQYTNNVEVGRIQKSPSTALVVSMLAKDGIRYLHIHEWYKKKTTNEWKPGIKSVSVPLIHPPIDGTPKHPADDLMELLKRAIDYGKNEFEIDNPDNYIYKK